MPEEPKEPAVEPIVEQVTEEPTTPTLEDVLKQNTELLKTLEQRTNELKGTDKKLGEINNQFTDFRNQHETDKQKTEREAIEAKELRDQEILRNSEELTNTKTELNQLKIDNVAISLGYTAEDLAVLKFKTPEEVNSHFEWSKARDEATTERLTKEFESGLSGARDQYKSVTKTDELSPLEQKIINRR
jgi:hypothetical protein